MPILPRRVALLLLTLSLVLIGALTLVPEPDAAGSGSALAWCLGCGTFGTVDLVMNVLLFVPLGASLGFLRVRGRWAFAIVLATTVLIECLQVNAVSGRDANLADIAANAAGGLVGIVLGREWLRVLMPTASSAAKLASAWSLFWIASRLATAFLLQPSPTDQKWFAQIAPRDVYPADFPGTVVTASLSGMPLAVGPLMTDSVQRLEFASGEVALFASLRSGHPTDRLASIVSVLDEDEEEILLLGQSGHDVRFRVRLRAADARLRIPTVILRRALAVHPGEGVALTGSLHDGTLVVSARSKIDSIRAMLPLGAGLGWALFTPREIALSEDAAIASSLVCFIFVLPVGYWLSTALVGAPRSGMKAALLIAITIAGSLVAPSFLAEASRPDWLEALGAGCGGLAGARLRRGLVRGRPVPVVTQAGF